MSQELYSVEQVAERLGLHVRTVRNYVRDGRLKAFRIGKQYRIARADLEALTGRPAPAVEREPARRHRHVEASSIVQIDAISPNAASRMTTLLMAATKGRSAEDQPLRVETIYDEARAVLKVVLVGSLRSTAEMFGLVTLYLKS